MGIICTTTRGGRGGFGGGFRPEIDTLCWRNGKDAGREGPYTERQEKGGILVLEARDESRHQYLAASGVKYGPGRTSCCGSERHDSGERTPPGKGHRAVSIHQRRAGAGEAPEFAQVPSMEVVQRR